MATIKEPDQKDQNDSGQESSEEARMTFTEHLGELRTRLVRSAIAVVVGMVVCYIFSSQIISAISRPLLHLEDKGWLVDDTAILPGEDGSQLPAAGGNGGDGGEDADSGGDQGETGGGDSGAEAAPGGAAPQAEGRSRDSMKGLTILNPLEPVLVVLRISAFGGILLALPFLVFQFCAFIFPGLRPSERQVVRFLIIGCTILALAGVGVAYFLIFPTVLPYLTMFAPADANIQFRMSETVSLILKGLFGFAVAFQFPMAVLILVYMGLLTPATLKQWRRLAVIAMFLLSMLLTPPDPFSMLLMAGPLIMLYEVSIWLSYLVVRRKAKAADAV